MKRLARFLRRAWRWLGPRRRPHPCTQHLAALRSWSPCRGWEIVRWQGRLYALHFPRRDLAWLVLPRLTADLRLHSPDPN